MRENTELRVQVAAFQNIIGLLKSMSPDSAQHSLHHLLTSNDPVAILQALRGKFTGTVISEQDTVRASFPAVHSKCELELQVRHPIAYLTLDISSRAESLRLHFSSFYSLPNDPLLQSQPASAPSEDSFLLEQHRKYPIQLRTHVTIL
ncbi:hypothetical protein B0J11DRAFT_543878 [Dendryphion nanum]|uniref:Uncharacterized protein n=1 Tax=Dendryphion nanum TaxID=256645 RepID=A0A9P9I7U2_9PLEO|nr:hypothetical protein B0J11DRAFT_543878 [Dendryphion nanum]